MHKQVVKRLVKGGCKPKLQRLDNEASALLRDCMSEQKIDFQLVPPINTEPMLRKEPCAQAKPILLLDGTAWIRNFLSISGIKPFPMQKWHSTYSEDHA